MPRTKKTNAVEIDALRHTSESRANIPTSELRDFIGDEEMTPPTLRYPRDPSLDPQLVWKGKDEQDGADLAVPAVPIYIQEKIQPQAIVEEVRRQAALPSPSGEGSGVRADQQLSLFGDFNGIEFEQMIEFYQHHQHWTNRMILGDSLLVMTSLAEKEGLKGQVQMIYLDPPYGIKFGSNWQVSTRKRDVKDGRSEDLSPQPEQIRAFRDTWEKGIHSYLGYLRDRLVLARELLTESGSIFVQIGDENVHLVRNLLDEVFGSENFCALISFQKTGGVPSNLLPSTMDFLLWYAKKQQIVKFHHLYEYREQGETSLDRYDQIELEDGITRRLSSHEIDGNILVAGRRYQQFPLYSEGETSQPMTFNYLGKAFSLRPGTHWKTTIRGLVNLAKANRIERMGSVIRYKRYADDFAVIPITDNWKSTQIGTQRLYIVQTSQTVIERCMLMTTDPGDLVLDPTMGSGTTAYVAEQWGRRWITIDTSRVALALARTRLMAARYPYYLLADSPEGAQKEMEISGAVQPSRSYTNNVKQGFVYERVPHITLRDIANNEEIDTIHDTWQPYLDERRAWLNEQLGTNWEEWEVPRELPDAADAVNAVLGEYWQARRERQTQIDASISRTSERETLYDRPYTDNKRVRVTGPFTVETLSPHRILDPGYAESAARTELRNIGTYEQMVIDNLRIAGVQNTRRAERLTFQTLDPYAGIWLHAAGTYLDAAGEERRVAVSIGSEHGTVTARQIKEAAKEAVRGLGYNLLLVCGFAFDAAASEESKRYGNLDVQIVRINSDLMIGGALKKTDAANLFTIFGEPDIAIEKQADGQIVVELRGLDIYDPTTGAIRSSSTDDIACWFIDSAYNDESFFVRHAYFLGNDQAYDNLKRALRAEVDESAWESLYSARSMPFARPEHGRIAVKVINHYGDEVLKVYNV